MEWCDCPLPASVNLTNNKRNDDRFLASTTHMDHQIRSELLPINSEPTKMDEKTIRMFLLRQRSLIADCKNVDTRQLTGIDVQQMRPALVANTS